MYCSKTQGGAGRERGDTHRARTGYCRVHTMIDTCKSGKLSYMALAMEREQSTCRSLPMVAGAVLGRP